MRITSWSCLCGDVSRRLSDLAPLRSEALLHSATRQGWSKGSDDAVMS